MTYRLPELFTEYLWFSIIYGFVLAVFIKQLIAWANCFTATLKTLADNIELFLSLFLRVNFFTAKVFTTCHI